MAIAALAALAAAGSPAAADELLATRAQPLDEISHTVAVRIADGFATYTVQRQFQNRGKVAEEARLSIDLPAGAAATGLRIRARGAWHTGELLDRELAADRYRELTGAGVHDPKDPALLFWVSPSELYLQVFPVQPGAVSTVEYTLTVPTRYAVGRYWLTYPRVDPADAAGAGSQPGARKLVDPIVTVHLGWTPSAGGIVIDGKPAAPGKPVALAARAGASASADTASSTPGEHDAPGLAVLTVEPPPMAAWTGRLGRVVASDAHAFARLELDAAPRLSAVPRRAQVVFVLDASYSAGAPLVTAQLAILRAYLAHVPDAELEVIAVRRTAKRVFGRFVAAAEAPRLLDAAVRGGALALGNGSALDEGARLAASLVAGRAGPQRIVLATDELLRSSLTNAAALAALAALAPDAVVHVVVPSADGASAGALPSLERDDAASLAALAAGHHGILARISGLPAKAPELEPMVLELVRPTRIDQLAIAGKSPLTVDDTLREGEGLRIFESGLTAAAAPSALSLTGKLWSDPILLDLDAAPAFSTATAAFVFGEDQHGQLSDAELRTVALAARAVSPVTSYLAIEPGVRPSKIGLDNEGIGAGWGTIGTGRYGTLSGCGGVSGTVVTKPDLASLIPTGACVRKHAPGGAWSVKLSIETTKDEIVDVEVVAGLAAGLAPLAACLAEAAWSVRLPASFDQERDDHTVELSGP